MTEQGSHEHDANQQSGFGMDEFQEVVPENETVETEPKLNVSKIITLTLAIVMFLGIGGYGGYKVFFESSGKRQSRPMTALPSGQQDLLGLGGQPQSQPQQGLVQQPLTQQPTPQQSLTQQPFAQQPIPQPPLAQRPAPQQPLAQQPLAANTQQDQLEQQGFVGPLGESLEQSEKKTVAETELVKLLLARLDDLEGKIQTCSVTKEEKQISTPVVADESELLKALKEEKEFVLKKIKTMTEKNNFLRKLERDTRYELKGIKEEYSTLQNENKSLKKQLEDLSKQKKVAVQKRQRETKRVAQAIPAGTFKKGPALPEGWVITGMCSTLVTMDNTDKQESVLLRIGESLEGVEILAINVNKKSITTSHGIARFK